MSRIFEALQQSESERAGSAASPVSAVELVQAAELLNAAERRSEATATLVPEIRELGQVRRFPMTYAPESRLVCLTQQGSLGAEKLRLLALRLKNMKESRNLRRLLITSTMPEEGKSLISANLAITLARSRHLKILLLECDLRRPNLATVVAGRSLPGLSDYLQTEVALNEVIYEADPAGFYFLPAGAPPANPLELMQSGRFQTLVDDLSSHFDWILIDSPPIMPLADTSLLMKISDGVLMVVREGVSETEPLQKAMEMIPPAQMLGVILNSSSNTDSKRYYQRYAALQVPTQGVDPESKSNVETSQ